MAHTGDIKWRRQLIRNNGIITKMQFVNDVGGNGVVACSVQFMENANDSTPNKSLVMSVSLLAIDDGSVVAIEADGWDYNDGIGVPSPVIFSDNGFITEVADSTQRVKDFCLLSYRQSIWLATLKTGQLVFTHWKGKERIEWVADPTTYGENAIFTLICPQYGNNKHKHKLKVHLLVQRMVNTNFSTYFPVESIVTLECSPEESMVYEQVTYISDNVNIPSEYLFLSQKSQGQCLAQLATISSIYHLDIYRLDNNSNLQYYRIELGGQSMKFTLDNLDNCTYTLLSQATMDKHLIAVTDDGAKHLKLPQNSTPCYCLDELVYAVTVDEGGKNYVLLYQVMQRVKTIAKFETSNKSKSISACAINKLRWHSLEGGIGNLVLQFDDQTFQSYFQMKFKFERFESLSNVVKTIDLGDQQKYVENKRVLDWFLFETEIIRLLYRMVRNIYLFLAKILPFVAFKIIRPIPFTKSVDPLMHNHKDTTSQIFTCEDFLQFHNTRYSCMLTLGKFDVSCAVTNSDNERIGRNVKFCGPFHHIMYQLYKVHSLKRMATNGFTLSAKGDSGIVYKDILVCLTSNNMIFGIAKKSGDILYHINLRLFNIDGQFSSKSVDNENLVSVISLGDGTLAVSNGENLYFFNGATGHLIKELKLHYEVTHLQLLSPIIELMSIPLLFASDVNKFATLIPPPDGNKSSQAHPYMTQPQMILINKWIEENVTVVKRDGDHIIGYTLTYKSSYDNLNGMVHLELTVKWSVSYPAAAKRIVAISVPSNQSMRGYCEFNSDKTFSLPSLNPHLLYIVSMDTKAQEGCVYKEKMLDVLDASKGKIVTSIILAQGASEPFKLLSTDNLLALHYWNAQFNRHELLVLESYNSHGDLEISSLVFGAPFGVSAMSVTKSRLSVLGKKFIFALSSGHFVVFDESIINARRAAPKNLLTYFFASVQDKILPNQVFPRIRNKVAKEGYVKDYETLIGLENGKVLNLFVSKAVT